MRKHPQPHSNGTSHSTTSPAHIAPPLRTQPHTPQDYLQLQRMAGNRAVQRLIQAKLSRGDTTQSYEQEDHQRDSQVISRVLDKNNLLSSPSYTDPKTAPHRKISTTGRQPQTLQRLFGLGKKKFKRLPEVMNKGYVDASSAGVIGVFFLSDHAPDAQGRKGNTIVVKFEPGDASSTLFAEQFLSGMGIATADSQMTPMKTRAGKAIYNKVGSLIKAGQINSAKAQAIGTKYSNGATAQTVVVADFIGGATVFDMISNTTSGSTKQGYNREDMGAAFMDPTVAFDLGRLMAFDAILGNGDRLKSQMAFSNIGNFMFQPKPNGGWRVVAIDNMTDAPTMEVYASQKARGSADEASLKMGDASYDEDGKTSRTIRVTVNANDMANKAYKGYLNQVGIISAGLDILQDNPAMCASQVAQNLRSGLKSTMAGAPSAVDAQVTANINWGLFEQHFLAGLNRATVQLQGIGAKKLKENYDLTKAQTGKVSKEVDIKFLQLKLKTLDLWATGDAKHTDIINELKQESQKLYKTKIGAGGAEIDFYKDEDADGKTHKVTNVYTGKKRK